MTTEHTQRRFRTRQERRIAELFERDGQFRAAAPLDAVTGVLERHGMPLAEVVAAVMDGYADRPALGQRAHELVTDERTGGTELRPLARYDTITYRELWSRAGTLATDWAHEQTLHPGEFLGLLGFTSTDYATFVLACVYSGVVAVPLQCGAPPAQLRPMVAETGMTVLATSSEYLAIAAEVAAISPNLRRIVVFDHHRGHDADRAALDRARARVSELSHPVLVETSAEAFRRARTLPSIPHHTGNDDALTMLVYTSGSTGAPKGAMYPQRLVAALWRGFQSSVNRIPVIGFNYLPMSHLAGHVSLIGTLARGGTGYFATASDLSTLFDDLSLARPTELNLVPRICDMLHQLYQSELGSSSDDARPVAAEQVRTRLRERVLGGRVVRAVCGTAPLAAETAAFMESCLDLELHDGYASTEAGGIMIDTHLLPPVTGYKLLDVPELGYFGTDRPHPRGELLLRTANIIPGYHQRPELNATMFDADGYFRTGDIVAELGPRQITYLDRRSNVRKLANGEFVAVAQLESVFTGCPSIHQIFVHGDSSRSYLLAVIVPTPEALGAAADESLLRRRLSGELRAAAERAGLRNYEVPGDFVVEPEPFSPANGLLSDSRKVLRPTVERRYADRFEQLYADAAQRRARHLRELRESDGATLDTLLRAVRLQFDGTDPVTSAESTFAELGGDSLSAVLFAELLQRIFDVEVPVHVIVSPDTDLRGLAGYLDSRRGGPSPRPGCTEVHGADATHVRATDLTVARVLGDDPRPIATDPGTTARRGHTLVLTGATGFLGRFVLLEQLARLPEGGTVICPVRAGDDAAARRRLDDIFGATTELAARYAALAPGRLDVVAADVTAPHLGLDERRWQRLATEADRVVHVGALVNHILPYRELYEPNVAGTAELIRLAVSERLKPFSYVSTIAAADPQSLTDENADVRSTAPIRTLGTEYAAGYATSKWAGEVLLRAAHDSYGLPVTVLRPSMILGHSDYPGQLNPADMFTRLLVSLALTGLAPRSFYRDDSGSVAAHFDGLPVEFVAESIVALGGGDAGYSTLHIVNPHDDGISLDTVVDCLIEAGHPMRRIDDYDDWLARFGIALHALPPGQRQHSALAILDAYRTPAAPIAGSAAACAESRAAVRRARLGRSGEIPGLSRMLVGKYLTDTVRLGLVPPNPQW
ncbi:carboxylic acid reductase [Nocardia sp. NPDC052254]|uniref:carboxylic acid reductase n=1 Tax=Nocardia sp. NPDC052254 TaxID=3155681 RepID=UPI0034348111